MLLHRVDLRHQLGDRVREFDFCRLERGGLVVQQTLAVVELVLLRGRRASFDFDAAQTALDLRELPHRVEIAGLVFFDRAIEFIVAKLCDAMRFALFIDRLPLAVDRFRQRSQRCRRFGEERLGLV